MKKIWSLLLLALAALTAGAQGYDEPEAELLPDTVYTVHYMTQEQFREVIADWSARDWVMKNERPVVVDFYADWCKPCRRLQPILRNLAHHYQGTVDFYRIDIEKNPEIANVFQIRSIPLLLICPLEGEPKEVVGLYSEQEFLRVINLAIGH